MQDDTLKYDLAYELEMAICIICAKCDDPKCKKSCRYGEKGKCKKLIDKVWVKEDADGRNDS